MGSSRTMSRFSVEMWKCFVLLFVSSHAQLQLSNVGESHWVDFLLGYNEGGSPASYMNCVVNSGICQPSFGGFTAEDVAAANSQLSSKVWRFSGVAGSTAGPMASGCDVLINQNLAADVCRVAVCDLVDFGNDRCDQCSNTCDPLTSGTSPSNAPTAFTSAGGLDDTPALFYNFGVISGASSEASIGIVPNIKSQNWSPGALHLKMENKMGRTVTGLLIRYTIAFNDILGPQHTNVKLQFTHHGGDTWYYTDIPGSEVQSPSGDTPTPGTWTWHYEEVVLEGITWMADDDFFIRWYIDTNSTSASDPDADTFGDLTKITDIELVPYAVDSADYALEIREQNSNFVDVPWTTGLAADSSYTIEMWVRPKGKDVTVPRPAGVLASPSEEYTLLSAYTGSAELLYSLVASGTWNVRYTDGTVTWTSTTVIATDIWSHIAIVRTGGTDDTFTLYVNGELKETSAAVADPSFTFGGDSVRIGRNVVGGTAQPFIGHIDEVSIWSAALTGTAIQQNMDGPLDTSASDLELYLSFNDASDTSTAVNSAPSGSAGTISSPDSPYSSLTPLPLASLNGGAVTCEDKYTSPQGELLCTATVMTQHGAVRTDFEDSLISIKILSGSGTIGPLLKAVCSADEGCKYTFKFFAASKEESVVLQGYASTVAFVGNPYRIHVVHEGCKGCEYRETLSNGDKVYSCIMAGKRFLYKNLLPEAGLCPA